MNQGNTHKLDTASQYTDESKVERLLCLESRIASSIIFGFFKG